MTTAEIEALARRLLIDLATFAREAPPELAQECQDTARAIAAKVPGALVSVLPDGPPDPGKRG